MNKKIVWIIIAVIVVVVVGLLIDKEENISSTKVGAILPLTGSVSYLGEAEKLGLEIALKELGADNIKLIIEDSQGDPKNAVTSAQKLLSQDEVKVIIISTSGSSLAVAPLQEKTKFLMIADTIDNRVAKTSPFIFRPKLGEVTGAINLARIINPANKTFAVLSVNLDFAKDIISSFESEVDSLGGSIVIKEMYDKGKTDFRTELTKIKGKGVDGIFFIDYSGPGSINFYKQRSELGLNDIEVYGDTLTGYDTFLKMDPQNREMMEGVISMVWPTTQEIASENKKLEQFIEKYEPKYGSLVKGFDVQYSYSYILLLDSIIKKCSHNDVDCFKDEMFKYTLTSPYDSIVGPIYFDKDGNGEASVKFVKLINGKWIEIK